MPFFLVAVACFCCLCHFVYCPAADVLPARPHSASSYSSAESVHARFLDNLFTSSPFCVLIRTNADLVVPKTTPQSCWFGFCFFTRTQSPITCRASRCTSLLLVLIAVFCSALGVSACVTILFLSYIRCLTLSTRCCTRRSCFNAVRKSSRSLVV